MQVFSKTAENRSKRGYAAMKTTMPCLGCLSLMFLLLCGCTLSGPQTHSDRDRAPAAALTAYSYQSLATYPVIAHQLHGEEAPIVRWIDTDGDGVSNYRLLCTFENGRLRVNKVVPDMSFRKRFRQS
jgi:hypothetical protein